MAPPNAERAAPNSGNGSPKDVRSARLNVSPDKAAGFRKQARDRLELHTDRLEIMADWKHEITTKERRLMLLWELGQLTYEEWEALPDEVTAFRKAADALVATLKGQAA